MRGKGKVLLEMQGDQQGVGGGGFGFVMREWEAFKKSL